MVLPHPHHDTHRPSSRGARRATRPGRTGTAHAPGPHAPPSSPARRAALARVLPLWPHELADESLAGRRSILARLERALRAERRRGVAGHWAYDLARHIELLRVYRHEQALLAEAERALRRP